MTAISKEEYLKRYLSGDSNSDKKKKKRKLKIVKHSNVRIIDDDVDLKAMNTPAADKEDGSEDETPTIAEFVDERPEHVRQLEQYRKNQRWKVLSQGAERDDIASKDYGVIVSVNKSMSKENSSQRHDSDSNASPRHVSPPRKKHLKPDSEILPLRKIQCNSGSNHSSPRRKRYDSDSDHSFPKSPPRKQRQGCVSNRSPPRNQRHDSDADQSPSRKQRHDSDSDQSPPRKQRHHNDSDQSPPRKQRHDSDSDQSPPRKQKLGNDSDPSPRRRQRLGNNSDQSPPRKQRHGRDSDGESDLSPARQRRHEGKKRAGSDSDQSPPRKKKHVKDSDQSSAKRIQAVKNSEQSSLVRKKYGGESNESPVRKKNADKSDDDLSLREQDQSERKKNSKPQKTLGGAKAGLSSAVEMKREAERLKIKENETFSKIDRDALGRDAKTVFRDKSGKRRDLAAEQKEEEIKTKKKSEDDKKYQEWGQGLKQIEMREQTLQHYAHEASKPLARYKDDEDLDRFMREMDREGDPMAKFLKKTTKETDPAKEKPRYKGPLPPPNRFGLMPGYRWDGVDRSNGFEKKIFQKQSEQKAVKEHAYKWSTEDM